MPRGEQTPTEQENAFRANYLRYGNVARAAREAGVPERTGYDLLKRAEADPEFTEIRDHLHATALQELEILAVDVARRSHERFSEDWDPPEPEDGATIVVRDPRPDYGKLVNDSLRSVSSHRARVMPSGSGDDRPDEIIFRRYVPTEAETTEEAGTDETPDEQAS